MNNKVWHSKDIGFKKFRNRCAQALFLIAEDSW